MNVLSTTTNVHHIFHPLTLEEPEEVGIVDRIMGIALFVIPGILTLGFWALFCLGTAFWKERKLRQINPRLSSKCIEKVP